MIKISKTLNLNNNQKIFRKNQDHKEILKKGILAGNLQYITTVSTNVAAVLRNHVWVYKP
jgi:hypothetical protein